MARTGMRERQLPHSRLVGISQPSRQLALSKSPLASDFDRGNFLAFRPETEGLGRNAEPFGNCRSSHQRFAVMRHVLGLSSCFDSRGAGVKTRLDVEEITGGRL